MINSSIFEAIMLLCFGMAWPISILKSWKSRSNRGKSLFFLTIIFIGYISGIIFKVSGNPDKIIILYICNGFMVAIDILIFFRNRKLYS